MKFFILIVSLSSLTFSMGASAKKTQDLVASFNLIDQHRTPNWFDVYSTGDNLLIHLKHSVKGNVTWRNTVPGSSLAVIHKIVEQEIQTSLKKSEKPCTKSQSFGKIQFQPNLYSLQLCNGNMRHIALSYRILKLFRTQESKSPLSF
ncbi:MAG TPA: hypothetical protein DCL41_05300 [Bdellovibrionales bacterium]|nr:hypothetical protein [Pseudobdellovibrionaceae bacterium]HAG91264.1 hypothetical protein [Bdellovibrionales bacterium]